MLLTHTFLQIGAPLKLDGLTVEAANVPCVAVTGHQSSPVNLDRTEKRGRVLIARPNFIYLRTFHRLPVTLVTVVMYKETLSFSVTSCHRQAGDRSIFSDRPLFFVLCATLVA